MKTRILSGLIMLPLLVFLWLGGKWLLLACFAVALMGVREFYNGFRKMGVSPCAPIGYAAAFCLYTLGLFLLSSPTGTEYIYPLYMLWFFGVTVASLLVLFKIEKRTLSDGMATLTGVFYVVFFSFHVVLVDSFFGIAVWLIVLTAFGTDIMAYFSGMAFGKHKLCPKISPKKTIEGSVGGILGSMVLCLLFAHFFLTDFSDKAMLMGLVIGLLGGIISQFGDLTASIFKRHMGIKDYGNLIPVHGGILARFDSVLFTASMVFYVLWIWNLICAFGW